MIEDINAPELVSKRSNRPSYKLTIIIPTYNRPVKLLRTIESLSVIQNNSDVSILLIDNNSINLDLSSIIVALDSFEFDYKIYKNKINVGALNNWNLGVWLTSSDYIMYLFDDDVLNSSFNRCYKLLETKPVYGLYFFNKFLLEGKLNQKNFRAFFSSFLRNSLNMLAKHKHTLDYVSMLNTVPSFIGAIYERGSLLSIGGFDESFGLTGDYEFTIRYWEKFGIVRYKYQIINYHHGSNDSSNPIIYNKFPGDNLKYRTSLLKRLNIDDNRKLKLERKLKYNFEMESKLNNRILYKLKFILNVILNYLNIL